LPGPRVLSERALLGPWELRHGLPNGNDRQTITSVRAGGGRPARSLLLDHDVDRGSQGSHSVGLETFVLGEDDARPEPLRGSRGWSVDRCSPASGPGPVTWTRASRCVAGLPRHCRPGSLTVWLPVASSSFSCHLLSTFSQLQVTGRGILR